MKKKAIISVLVLLLTTFGAFAKNDGLLEWDEGEPDIAPQGFSTDGSKSVCYKLTGDEITLSGDFSNTVIVGFYEQSGKMISAKTVSEEKSLSVPQSCGEIGLFMTDGNGIPMDFAKEER